jgi:hypothetical protein
MSEGRLRVGFEEKGINGIASNDKTAGGSAHGLIKRKDTGLA